MRINKVSAARAVFWHLLVSSLILLLLAGCSDRGGDEIMITPPGKKGRFIDSHVEGLRYSSFGYAGVTGKDGTFIYHPGLPVTFSVGHVTLGTASPEDIVTPIHLGPRGADINHPKVINIAQFLQSLDLDGDPRNGILIPEQIREGLAGIPINFSAEDFEGSTGVQRVFDLLNESNVYAEERSLVSAEEAQIHLEETLIGIELEDLEAEENRDKSLKAYIERPRYNSVVIAGIPFNLQGHVQGGTGGYTFFWDMGDDRDSNKKDPGWTTFDVPGTYTVLFTAIDSGGDSYSDYRFITSIHLLDYSQPYEEMVFVVITRPESLNVKPSESLHLPAEIKKGNPPFGYVWRFDNTVVYTWDENPLDATFTFTEEGRHTISIFCKDAMNDTWVDRVIVNVQE